MTSQEMYRQADAILEECRHQTDNPCEVFHPDGRTLKVCHECWNRHVYARRAARKQALAEWRATLPKCQRCGKRAGNWQVGPWHLCGRCKSATEREHYRNLAQAGGMAIFAAGPCVDTSKWANPPQAVQP
jgi:hypothetical protein